jgi:hypothetical protein
MAAEAEQYERNAQLEGQAKTYGGGDDGLRKPSEARNRAVQAEANSTGDDPYDDEFVPGSRHMPMR